ncbi:MAG: ankyrin repeat domain-containing protein [Planctomycetota bacterium]|nr:ankyrin repeat domain-containing protein [Planctomycetota bacterium]
MAKRKASSLREWFDNCGGWSARHDLDELRRGIKAGLLNEQDEYGMTALHLAVSSGWLEGIKELLSATADTELRYFRTGEPPLLTAANDLGTGNGERLNSKAMVAMLVAGGANPDAANHFGLTPRKAAQVRGDKSFADIPAKPVDMPEPRIQNAEHLADHYHPRFKIPDREERETMQVGQAVDLYVYGPKAEGKQDTVKVRITARSGQRPQVRYTADVETPIESIHLPAGITNVEFGPENIASVYVARPKKKAGRTKRSS